jgi:flavodoxin
MYNTKMKHNCSCCHCKDNPFGESTGAAVIFGVTGGVMEAALRTAADVLSGKNIENVKYDSVRGLYGIKESTIKLGSNEEIPLSVAVCHQMRNVREFLAQIEEGEKKYHFIEIMTCPGGCIGGGGLPQSRDADILSKRISSVYSMDERMVKRKSHDNAGVKQLYSELLEKPLSHISHELLHTHYFARPRLPPISLKAPATPTLDLGEDSSNTIYVIFGTQSGTAAQAAKEIKVELQQFIGRSKMCPEPNISLVAGDALPPNSLLKAATGALAAIFVTCTFGEGEFPENLKKFWGFLQDCEDGHLEDSFRYAVFGLGSSMYAAGDQFNRAARQLDEKLNEMGAERMIDVGLGDDQSSEQYRGALDHWIELLLPKLFEGKGSAKGASYLDPPEPMFRLSMAPGKHRADFLPLPQNYHFIKLESIKSVVSPGYSRPAAIFSFDLTDTGLDYEVGDHLAFLPRNPDSVVDRILSLYSPEINGDCLLSVETIDHLSDNPYPTALTARELLTQYLDLSGRPSRSFLKQLFLFASTREARDKLRVLFERDNPNSSQDDFEFYTDTHT